MRTPRRSRRSIYLRTATTAAILAAASTATAPGEVAKVDLAHQDYA